MASSNLELYEASMLGKSSLASLLQRAQTLAAQLELAPLPDEVEADQEMAMTLIGNNYEHRLKRFERLESKLSEMRAAVAQLGSAEDANLVDDGEAKENVDANLPRAQKQPMVDSNEMMEAKDDNVDRMEEEDEESNTSLPILLPKTPSKTKAKPRTERQQEQQAEEEDEELLVRRSTRIAAKQSADVEPPEPVRATRRTTRLTAANKKRAEALPPESARVTRQTNATASGNKRRHVDGDAVENSFETTPDGKNDSPNQVKDSEEAVEMEKASSTVGSSHEEEKRSMSEDAMEEEEDAFRSCETSLRSAEKKNDGNKKANKAENEEEDMDLDECEGTSSADDVNQDNNNRRSLRNATQAPTQSIKDGANSHDRCDELTESSDINPQGQNEKQPEASNVNTEEHASVGSNLKDPKLAPPTAYMNSKRNLNTLTTTVTAPGSGSKFVTNKFSFVQKDPTVSKAAVSKEEARKQREEALKSKEEHRQAILEEQQKLKRRIMEERRQENEEKMRRAEEKRRQHEEELRHKAIKKQEKIIETERFNKAKEALLAKERKRAEEEEKAKREQLKQRLLWEEKKAQLEKTEQQQRKEQQKIKQHQSQASTSMFQMLVQKQKQKKEAEIAQSSSSNLNSTFTIENDDSTEAKSESKVGGINEGSDTNVKPSTDPAASNNLNSTFTIGKDKKGKATRDSNASVSESYDITPAHHELPPENLEDSQNYDINDIKSDDDTDDEDQPRKKIPSWASGVMLRNALLSQSYSPPDLDGLFGVMSLEGVRLEVIFKEHRKRFFKRTSSACWDLPPITHKFH